MDKEKEESNFFGKIGQRIGYLFSPSKLEKVVDGEVTKHINSINDDLAVFSKSLAFNSSGQGSNFVLYDVVSSRGGFSQEGFAYTETRPMMDFFMTYGMNHATLMVIITALRGEVFRNGLAAKPLFESKCASCQATFDNLVEECPACKSKDIIEPDIKMRERLENEVIDPYSDIVCNKNDQTVIEVAKELFLDICLLDVEYSLIGYKYKRIGKRAVILNEDKYKGGIEEGTDPIPDREYSRFERAHPALIRPYVKGSTIGGIYTCINHRRRRFEKKGLCDECDSILFPVTHARFKPENEEVEVYLIKGEVIQASKTFPNPIGGVPPVRFLFKPLELISKQSEHMVTYYTLSRNPNGFIWIKHDNADDLKAFWDAQLELKRKNRHHIPLMQVPSDVTGDAVGYLSVDSTPAEMEFIPTRDEATRIAASFYGVSPIFLNDASTGGGLNNEGLQITVTNRAAAVNQEFVNTKILAPLVRAMGITDFTLVLNPSEEQDEKAELELEILQNTIAEGWQRLGYEVERDEEGKWILGEKKEVEEMTDPFAEAMRDEEGETKKPSITKPVKPHSSSPAKPKTEVSV